jgi:S1-C subfamily serine protease
MTALRALLTVAVAGVALTACAGDPPAAVVGLSVVGCPPNTAHGTGVVIEGGLILASAHVVKGATEITVETAAGSTTATVVAFDPTMDLALLRPTTTMPHALPLSDGPGVEIERGTPAHAYVFRDDAVVVLEVEIRRPVNIRTEDIYIEGETLRPGFEIGADIDAGDSGGPVVVDGEVVGVVWARSNQAADRAYAVDPVAAGKLVRSQMAAGQIDSTIDLTRCH